MAQPLTAMDEHFVHQIPEPLPNVLLHHPHWRESYFFGIHRPDALGDILPVTEVIEFPGATHGAHISHPDAFAAFVRRVAELGAGDDL